MRLPVSSLVLFDCKGLLTFVGFFSIPSRAWNWQQMLPYNYVVTSLSLKYKHLSHMLLHMFSLEVEKPK